MNGVSQVGLGQLHLQGGRASLGLGLGLMHLYGKGEIKDYEKALDYFHKSAEQSWMDGQLHLGNM